MAPFGAPNAAPTAGAVIEAKLTIHVGYSNGDFRRIVVRDHRDRPIATGDIPWRALREIEATNV